MKSKFLAIIISAIISNASAYQATTETAKNVEQFADELTLFLADYQPYSRVVNPHAVAINPSYHKGSGWQKVALGVIGNGAYSAKGGERFEVRYRGAEARGSLFYVGAYVHGMGINGTSLYGDRLEYLYEKAILLDSLKKNIASVFSEKVTGDRVNLLKKTLAELDFGSSNRPLNLLTILNNIEPEGRDSIDLTKSYSEDAVLRSQVSAINQLNATMHALSQILSPEEYTLFFDYVSAFVDHGGSSTDNAIIDDPQSLNIPDYQLYKALPTNEELIEYLITGNRDIIYKPTELRRISNDEDLKRILGHPYEELDKRSDKFIELFEQVQDSINGEPN